MFSLLICFVILLEMFSILPSLTSAMWLSKLYYFVVFGFFRSQEKIKTLFVAVLAICCSTMKKVPNHFCFSFVSFFHFCPCNCFQKLIFIYRDFCRLWCLFHFIYSSSQWYLSWYVFISVSKRVCVQLFFFSSHTTYKLFQRSLPQVSLLCNHCHIYKRWLRLGF